MSLEKALERLKEAQKMAQETQKQAESLLKVTMNDIELLAKTNSDTLKVKEAQILAQNLIREAKKGGDISTHIQAIKDKINK